MYTARILQVEDGRWVVQILYGDEVSIIVDWTPEVPGWVPMDEVAANKAATEILARIGG